MVSGAIRCGELESGIRLTRMQTVARQPIRSDFTERWFAEGFEGWGTRRVCEGEGVPVTKKINSSYLRPISTLSQGEIIRFPL